MAEGHPRQTARGGRFRPSLHIFRDDENHPVTVVLRDDNRLRAIVVVHALNSRNVCAMVQLLFDKHTGQTFID